jgi:MoaA/NifB/PqqE/SkfB family radical SAM enzyme
MVFKRREKGSESAAFEHPVPVPELSDEHVTVHAGFLETIISAFRDSPTEGCALRKLPASKYARSFNYQFTNFIRRDFVFPFYASYKVTTKCDRRCEFCNVHLEKVRILETEEVFKVLDNIGRSSIFLLSMEGGDPLLRRDIAEILEYQSTKPFLLLFTTSGEQFHKIPMDEYGKYIDFLHISIDEGHGNVYLYDKLGDFTHWGPIVCAQIVVRNKDMGDLENKITKCHGAGAKAVVMPACHIPNTDNMLPDPDEFSSLVLKLKKKYPNTIINPDKYLTNFKKPHTCTTASIIVDSDGSIFYPCRTLEEKPFSLLEKPLDKIVLSKEAEKYRDKMKRCDQHCHWYQYFAADSFLNATEIFGALRPYFDNLFGNNGGSMKGDNIRK